MKKHIICSNKLFTEFNQTKGLKLLLKQRMPTYHFLHVEMLAERDIILCYVVSSMSVSDTSPNAGLD